MSSFKLHSEDSEFNNRVDTLFSSLQTAAVDLEPQTKRSWEEDEDNEEEEDSEDSFGRIGQKPPHKFRRPEGLPPQWRGRGGHRGNSRTFGPRNSTPDYVKNPQNWTRYNMKDVKVLSDRENKQIGLQLLDDLRSQRIEKESGDYEASEEEEVGCPKITFKKPVKPEVKNKSSDDNEDESESNISADALFGGTKKFRMEEYEVGQSKPKSKPKVVKSLEEGERKNKKGEAVKLKYLMYEEEEEDDDEDD